LNFIRLLIYCFIYNQIS